MIICRDQATNKDYIYYYPYEIIFRREHCLFLLEHWELLSQGIYPHEPSNGQVVSTISTIRPKWNAASNLKAEICLRLERCKDAGRTLLHEVSFLHIDRVDYLSPAARDALKYIEGWYRKKMSFADWKKQRRYRNGV